MKPSVNSPLFANVGNLENVLEKTIQENSISAYLGTLLTTRGVLVLLFSQRYNCDVSILVSGTDMSAVLTKVFDILKIADIQTPGLNGSAS